MSEPSQKSRFAVDLDELERQLRDMQSAAPRQPEADPLAELARLVGQDDPLKDVFAASPGAPRAGAQPQAPTSAEYSVPPEDLRGSVDEFDAIFDRREPARELAEADHGLAFEDELAREVMAAVAPQQGAVQQVAPYQGETPSAGPQDPLAALDDMVSRDLDRYLADGPAPARRDAPAGYDAEAAAIAAAGAAIAGSAAIQSGAGRAAVAEPANDEFEEPQRRRFGKGAMTAAVLIGVGLVGVAGAAVWRGGGKSTDGQPRVIAAEPGPSRVQPQNPGGTVVPDQNKQIYERGAATQPGQSAVVNRDEQPVDVQAAVRNQPRVVFPGPGAAQPQGQGQEQASATPGSASPAGATAALGEPRRVRTIAIRPDGTVIAPPTGTTPAASAPAPVVMPQVPPVAAAPAAGSQPSAAQPGGITRVQAPRPATAPTPVSEPAAPAAVAVSGPASPPRQMVAAAPATPAAQPQRPAPQPRPAPAPAAETPAATGGGGFAVQLAAPGSESEARSVFSSLQRRFPDELGGQRPLIRRAEVNGREVYRLRVGPMSREGAADLCTRLKAKGGQCFLAGA